MYRSRSRTLSARRTVQGSSSRHKHWYYIGGRSACMKLLATIYSCARSGAYKDWCQGSNPFFYGKTGRMRSSWTGLYHYPHYHVFGPRIDVLTPPSWPLLPPSPRSTVWVGLDFLICDAKCIPGLIEDEGRVEDLAQICKSSIDLTEILDSTLTHQSTSNF